MKNISFLIALFAFSTTINMMGQTAFTINGKQYNSIALDEATDNDLFIGRYYEGGFIAAITKDGKNGIIVSASDDCKQEDELDNPESGNPNCPAESHTKAKKLCSDIDTGGETWQLPTKKELDVIRLNLHNNGMAEIEKTNYWLRSGGSARTGQANIYNINDGTVKKQPVATATANTRCIYVFKNTTLDLNSNLEPEPVFDTPNNNTNTANLDGKKFYIQAKHSGKYFTTTRQGGKNNIVQGGTASRILFRFERRNDGSYKIYNDASGDLLTNWNGNNLITDYFYEGEQYQSWRLLEQGNGYYIMESVSNAKVVDVAGSSADDLGNILLWGKTSNDNQLFKLVKTDAIATNTGGGTNTNTPPVTNDKAQIAAYLKTKGKSFKEVILGDNTSKEAFNQVTPEGTFECSFEEQKVKAVPEKLPVTNDSDFYPGALLNINKNVIMGMPSPITALARTKITCTPSNGTSFEADPSAFSSMNDAIRTNMSAILGTKDKIDIKTSKFNFEEVYSKAALSIRLNASVDAQTFSASTDAKFSADRETKFIVATAEQIFYSLAVDVPASPADFFADNVSLKDVKGELGSIKTPGYVSEVGYGKKIAIIFHTDISTKVSDIKAMFNYNGAGADFEGEVELNTENKDVYKKVSVFTYGGTTSAQAITSESQLNDYLDEYTDIDFSTNNLGAPLYYKVRYISNDEIAMINRSTDVYIPTCNFKACENYMTVWNPAPMTVRLVKVSWEYKGVPASRVVGDASGGNKGCGNLGQGGAWRIQIPCAAEKVKVNIVSLGGGDKTLGFGPVTLGERCIRIKGGTAIWNNGDRTGECNCSEVRRRGRTFKMGEDCK